MDKNRIVTTVSLLRYIILGKYAYFCTLPENYPIRTSHQLSDHFFNENMQFMLIESF